MISLSLAQGTALADGKLDLPRRISALGSYGGVAYTQYDGFFSGRTSTGDYRVPYRIEAPSDPTASNHTILVEPPHFGGGPQVPDAFVTRPVFYGNHFMHGAVGYSLVSFGDGITITNRILDPTAPGVFIHGGVIYPFEDGTTDDEIIVDFARALATDRVARTLVGTVDYRYISGFSDSSDPVERIVVSGRAENVFDLVMPYIADATYDARTADLRDAFALGRFTGKIASVNSEVEWFYQDFHDTGAFPNYRYWIEPGSAHANDSLTGFPEFSDGASPASYHYQARARFLQLHDWVTNGIAPPASTHLVVATAPSSCPAIILTGRDPNLPVAYLARDANCNALLADATGHAAPRLPFVELGEAQYVTSFDATYCTPGTDICNWCPADFPPWAPCNSSFVPPSFHDLVAPDGTPSSFTTFADYLAAFDASVDALLAARHIIASDAPVLKQRAALAPDLTFTGNYQQHYAQFLEIPSPAVPAPHRGPWVSRAWARH